MFGWIPLIGPVIDGVVSIFKNVTDVQMHRDDNDVQVIKVQNDLVMAFKDDIGLRIIRDALIVPIVVWFDLVAWDTIMALSYPQWMFHVASFSELKDPALQYLPYAVLIFLLGQAFTRRMK